MFPEIYQTHIPFLYHYILSVHAILVNLAINIIIIIKSIIIITCLTGFSSWLSQHLLPPPPPEKYVYTYVLV